MLKMAVYGFPHSSQDTETITCAETTIWAIMEYFGYKYAEYKPSSPSRIIEALQNVSAERQVPSKGLNIQQMAFAIKEFGFGPRIYSKTQFDDSFHSLISTYVESGIPIIVAIENSTIGHAILCIGRESYSDSAVDGLVLSKESDPGVANVLTGKRIQLYDLADLDNGYIFIDDNHPVYQKTHLSKPAANYSSTDWQSCEITYFIAPLYPKIYLEAFEAKLYFKQFFFRHFADHIPEDSEVVVRFFLASSRSFKHSVALDVSMGEDIRDIILETAMPKFVWIGELSDKEKIKKGKANGVVILDATEANTLNNKPLILAAFNNKITTFAFDGRSFPVFDLPFPDFSIFTNNLKEL